MIKQRNLSLISNKTSTDGGRRIPEDVIERDYCIAWLLVCLGASSLSEALAFKGGTCLRRCYFRDYRFSEDMDFTLVRPTPIDALKTGFEEAFRDVRRRSGIAFKIARQEPDSQNTHTLYFGYEGPLPAANREVKVDITFRETIVTKVQRMTVIKSYEEFEDLPEDGEVLAYSLDEIMVEKIAAITDKARTEPRDIYDLWRVTAERDLDFGLLTSYVTDKIRSKGDDPAGRVGNLEKKEKRLAIAWERRLSHQISDLPSFDDVFREVRRIFRKMSLFEGAR